MAKASQGRDTKEQNGTPAAALTPAQEKALEALLAGQSVTAAAEACGIGRTTLHRWLKDDFGFQAAYNHGRQELREAVQARLAVLADKAVACLECALERPSPVHVKTALALLKGMGLLPGELAAIGSADPADLAALASNAAELAVIRRMADCG